MTRGVLLAAMRHCASGGVCKDCPIPGDEKCGVEDTMTLCAIEEIEKLINENRRLRQEMREMREKK